MGLRHRLGTDPLDVTSYRCRIGAPHGRFNSPVPYICSADSSRQSYAQRGGFAASPHTPGSPQKGGEQEKLTRYRTQPRIHARNTPCEMQSFWRNSHQGVS